MRYFGSAFFLPGAAEVPASYRTAVIGRPTALMKRTTEKFADVNAATSGKARRAPSRCAQTLNGGLAESTVGHGRSLLLINGIRNQLYLFYIVEIKISQKSYRLVIKRS